MLHDHAASCAYKAVRQYVTQGPFSLVQRTQMGSGIDSSPWKLPRPTGSEQVSGEAVGPSLQVTAHDNGAQRPMSTPATTAQEPTLPPRTTLYASIPERLLFASEALVQRPPVDCICNDPQCCPEAGLAPDKPKTLSCPTGSPCVHLQGCDSSRHCIPAEPPDAREALPVLSHRLWPIHDPLPDKNSNVTSIGTFLGHPMHS